ncbi:MAG: hypothetical protein JW874_14605 [Spirochaetales bacterium]|nr:hypothetical protein [Spirochaetales bacterium]
MSVHYYLAVFPIEALIASELTPGQFGTYMATGSKKGSAEQIIFAEITGEFSSYFDWEYAKKTCVPHQNGDPKHSTYLSIYRVLEHVPFNVIGDLYLVTRDGRSLALKKSAYKDPEVQDYYLYHELCPVAPVIISSLMPKDFAAYLTDKKNKISVPKIVFADLKNVEPNTVHTGNIGGLYDSRNAEHFLHCIESVKNKAGKKNKTIDRSHLESFTFNSIQNGIFIGDGKEILFYKLPAVEEIKNIDYDWGRSAMIL